MGVLQESSSLPINCDEGRAEKLRRTGEYYVYIQHYKIYVLTDESMWQKFAKLLNCHFYFFYIYKFQMNPTRGLFYFIFRYPILRKLIPFVFNIPLALL